LPSIGKNRHFCQTLANFPAGRFSVLPRLGKIPPFCQALAKPKGGTRAVSEIPQPFLADGGQAAP
jgi:hypothetical protein